MMAYNTKQEFGEFPGARELYSNTQWLWLTFFIVNVAVTTHIVYSGWQLPNALEQLAAEWLPVVAQPVAYLVQQGNTSWAATVQTVYCLNWLSFIVFLAIYVGLLARLRRVIFTAIRAGNAVRTERYSVARDVCTFFLMLFLVVYISYAMLFVGNYDFQSSIRVFSDNAVHVRFVDIYRISFLMTCVGILSFFVVFIALKRIFIHQFK